MYTYEITIYSFLTFAAFTFCKFLFVGDSEDKKLQKIFGGLIILITASLSKNGWVMSVSIFISGLIVASEDFMRFLAAVMRTSGDKVAETVKALQTQKASPKEIEEKIQKESKDLEIKVFDNIKLNENNQQTISDSASLEVAPALNDQTVKTSNEKVRERMEKIKRVETLVQQYLKEKFSDSYETHMKITNNEKFLIVDGMIRKNNKIRLIIEIRYITAKSFSRLKYIIVGFREKLLKLGIKRPILMLVVSEEITQKDAQLIYEDSKGFANFMFFRLVSNHLEPIEVER